MEAFVQMPLETYNELKFNSEYLKTKLKEELESHNEDAVQAQKEIKDLTEKIDQYKQYILECRCKWLDVERHSLEHYLNTDPWNYGMNCKDELLSLGITKLDMDEFIVDKYEEYLKEKEEDEDEDDD